MAPGRRAELAPWIFLAHLGVTIVALIVLAAAWGGMGDDAAWIHSGCLAFVALGIWSYWTWQLCTGRLFDAYSIFLLALLVFSGGQLVLQAFGLLPGGLLDDQYAASTTLRAVLLVNASVAAFHLGALLRVREPPPAVAGLVHGAGDLTLARVEAIRVFGVLLFAASTPAMIYQAVNALRLAAAGGYMAIYQQEVAVGLQNWHGVLAGSFPPALLMVFASHAARPGWRALCWALASLSIGASLMIGTRSTAVLLLAPMLLVQHALVAPVRRATVLALGVAALILFPVIAQVRAQSLPERRRVLSTITSEGEPAFVPAIREMGGSMMTVAETIDLVPAVRPFDEGQGYFRALSTAVPNVFGELHPAVRGGTWAQWLMARIDPVQFAMGGGVGFSMIAEAYANFSWAGAPLVMFLFGLALGGAVAWCREQPAMIGMGTEASLLAVIATLPRSETSSVVRGIAWYVLLPLAFAAWRVRRERTGTLK